MSNLDETLAADDAPARADQSEQPSRPVAVGGRVGRYLVLARIGAGGMGEVFAAYDPELDRKLALKLLHGDRSGGSSTIGRTRLLREAQAMARLSHPNTVTVHDVGEHEGRVFLAMEFIAGRTLGEWLAGERRSWRAIVPVFAAAGRGLAAAHAAGLIHRDFKPDNVMLGNDGRVKVMDFGLARSDDLSEPSLTTRLGLSGKSGLEALRAQLDASEQISMSATLTQLGSLTGTPAYMAPEQFLSQPTDARTDQFAFCVALHEALFGERPFPGDNPAALALAVVQGNRREPPETKVPSWLRRVIDRGLEIDPARRWPSLDALIAELERDRTRRLRRAGVALAGVALLGAAALPWLLADEPQVCSGGASAMDELWGPERRSAAEAAVRATKLDYAGATWERVAPTLDAWTRDWVAAREDACEATEVHREQSEAIMQQRMRCLDRQRQAFAVLVEDLLAADAEVLEGAVAASQALPSPERCADLEHVGAEVPPPDDPTLAAEVEQLREQLAASERLRRVAPDERRAEVEALRDRALALPYPPLHAEAELRIGRLYAEQAWAPEAIAALRSAYFSARALGLDEVAMRSAIALIYVTGELAADYPAAFEWAEHAAAEVRRSGTDEDEAARLDRLAQVRMAKGDNATAEAELRRALELLAASGSGDARAAEIRVTLADLLQDLERDEEAKAEFDRAGAQIEAELGDGHPMLGLVRMGQAQLLAESHDPADLERGLALLDEAARLFAETLPPDHPWVAEITNERGLLLLWTGDRDGALASFEAAASLRRARLGPRHPSVAAALINAGSIARTGGDLEASLAALREAESILEQAGATKSRTATYLYLNLAGTLASMGRIDEAADAAKRCELASISVYGPVHDQVVRARIFQASIATMTGEWATAHALMLGALDMLEQRKLGADEPTYLTLSVLAAAELELGLAEDALAHIEQALAFGYVTLPSNELETALTHARALSQLGRTSEARAVADAALERLAASEAETEIYQRLRDWRRAH